ncbi:hypothetical protein [Amycolatopsis pithecellobii]|uniref:Uncharacterized protein n=1 Tax=Amycolatopsis pithecellobii TaxID=664692 RepID=A0A6N7YSM3_9PSEU|nr:hypothetical protein [Amycolatopsis pithecellobii]MTD54938.1 hypothetical protein [Amycolatopsis pithecellobii]
MGSLFILDVPENRPVVETADEDPRVTVRKMGPYFAVASDEPFSIDRRATGCRHAVWYSCIAGLAGLRITQWDKDKLAMENR